MNNIETAMKWVEKYVIKLELCPFAVNPFRTNKIGYKEVLTTDLLYLENILSTFSDVKLNDFETEILIFPELGEFDDFLDYYYGLEELIQVTPNYEVIKLVGFHPNYKHGGEGKDVLNFSNIAPLPIIQLLNTHDIEVKSSVISPEVVLSKNEQTLQKIGSKKLQNMINEFRREN